MNTRITVEDITLQEDDVLVIAVGGGQVTEETCERLEALMRVVHTGERGPHAVVIEAEGMEGMHNAPPSITVSKVKQADLKRKRVVLKECTCTCPMHK